MAKAYTTMVLRDDPSVVDYVEFLRDELEDEKLVQKAGVSETLCMRVGPCEFHGSFVEPFWI